MVYGLDMDTDLTRVTVNLIPRAAEALDEVVQLTGDSKTDSINRALQIYAFLQAQQATGTKILLERLDGSIEGVRFL